MFHPYFTYHSIRRYYFDLFHTSSKQTSSSLIKPHFEKREPVTPRVVYGVHLLYGRPGGATHRYPSRYHDYVIIVGTPPVITSPVLSTASTASQTFIHLTSSNILLTVREEQREAIRGNRNCQ
ncbi:hypothetical protein J6590_022288 [Homalodisca vitripennis]|nr:hypothetical protein J6590_022288 [Homalodisca vitripennis]